MDDNDDGLATQLSAETFAALQEFYKEQELDEATNSILQLPESESEITFKENWQLSQFWYDDETVDILTRIITKCVPVGKIALISCPTLYKSVKATGADVQLFEFDERFAAWSPDFIRYDYRTPLMNIPEDFVGKYELVVADPPFLSAECLTKTADTIGLLTKSNSKIVLCTGVAMADLAFKLLAVKKCDRFEPKHRHNLANQFGCFTNFHLDPYL